MCNVHSLDLDNLATSLTTVMVQDIKQLIQYNIGCFPCVKLKEQIRARTKPLNVSKVKQTSKSKMHS